jgi:hypothetical protein
VFTFGSLPQAGPWYLYWPYEAHFNMGAPNFGAGCPGCGVSGAWLGPWPGYGYGTGAYGVASPADYFSSRPGTPQAPMMAKPNQPTPQGPMAVQPTVYTNQVPHYWYGK